MRVGGQTRADRAIMHSECPPFEKPDALFGKGEWPFSGLGSESWNGR